MVVWLAVQLAPVGCFGYCAEEPLVNVWIPGRPLLMLRQVQPNHVDAILTALGRGQLPPAETILFRSAGSQAQYAIQRPRREIARKLTAPPIVAAIVPTRVSRFFTCDSSWARTPSSSRRSIIWVIPEVTATAAWLGLRPVAKALGCADGIR